MNLHGCGKLMQPCCLPSLGLSMGICCHFLCLTFDGFVSLASESGLECTYNMYVCSPIVLHVLDVFKILLSACSALGGKERERWEVREVRGRREGRRRGKGESDGGMEGEGERERESVGCLHLYSPILSSLSLSSLPHSFP